MAEELQPYLEIYMYLITEQNTNYDLYITVPY